jgi:flagellar hook-associated protein 2
MGASTSMAASSMYVTYSATSSNSILSATAGGDATGTAQDVTITQSATTGTVNGSKASSVIKGSTAIGSSTSDGYGLAGTSFNLTVDGVTKNISFSSSDLSSVTDSSGLVTLLNTKLQTAFGQVPSVSSSGSIDTSSSENKVQASIDSSGYLEITSGSGYDSTISVASGSSTSSADSLSALGLTSGQQNRLDLTGMTLGQLFQSSGTTVPTGDISVMVNGTSVDIGSSSTTLSSAFSTINSSGAGATISYDSTTDVVSVAASQSGSAGTVDLTGDTSGFFSSLGITTSSAKATGQDAILTVNGNNYTRATNSFTIDGVSYTINSPVTTPTTATVTMTPSTSNLSTGINNFISAYNTLITAINTQIQTQPDSAYPPLTSTQEASMTSTEITEWNTKAQQGLLYEDPTLQGIADSLRQALYKPVTLSNGTSVSLYDFGITTSDDPTQFGTLEIKTEDSQTFQNAIANNASEIKEFFTKESSISLDINPQTSDEVTQQQDRTSGEGLVDRLDDVIKAASSTVGGVPGSLLTMAGATGDATQYNNTIYNKLTQLNSDITDYNTQLTDKENYYYNEFENLETFMEQANSESSSLTSMAGSL